MTLKDTANYFEVSTECHDTKSYDHLNSKFECGWYVSWVDGNKVALRTSNGLICQDSNGGAYAWEPPKTCSDVPSTHCQWTFVQDWTDYTSDGLAKGWAKLTNVEHNKLFNWAQKSGSSYSTRNPEYMFFETGEPIPKSS